MFNYVCGLLIMTASLCVDETAVAGASVTLTDAELDKVTAGTGVSQASWLSQSSDTIAMRLSA